jgi:multiple sugar transport system substrate-binding protein
MYLLGSFVAQQFAANEQDDIDFFTFPEVDSTIGADAIDAPIDGFMLAKTPMSTQKSISASVKLIG